MTLSAATVPVLQSSPKGNDIAVQYPDGFSLSYWDLWLILAASQNFSGSLAALEKHYVSSLKREDRDNGWHGGSSRHSCEDYLHQLRDLIKRIPSGIQPGEIIGSIPEKLVKKESRKALRNMIEFYACYPESSVMHQSPRNAMEREAMRGEWGRLTVDPTPISEHLKPLFISRQGFFEKGETFALSRRIEKAVDKEIKLAERLPMKEAQLYAVYRAATTTYLENYSWDDSYGNMSQVFTQWLEKLGEFSPFTVWVDPKIYLKDLLFFLIWEDYGCTEDEHLNPLLAQLSAAELQIAKDLLDALYQKCIDNYQWYKARQTQSMLQRIFPSEYPLKPRTWTLIPKEVTEAAARSNAPDSARPSLRLLNS